MYCKEFAENINDLGSHALSGEVADEVRVHITECADCAALSADLQRTRMMIGTLDRKTAPIGFNERVKNRIAE